MHLQLQVCSKPSHLWLDMSQRRQPHLRHWMPEINQGSSSGEYNYSELQPSLWTPIILQKWMKILTSWLPQNVTVTVSKGIPFCSLGAFEISSRYKDFTDGKFQTTAPGFHLLYQSSLPFRFNLQKRVSSSPESSLSSGGADPELFCRLLRVMWG